MCEQAGQDSAAPELVALLELLGPAYLTGDEIVRNLIDVSFVEMVEDDPAVVRLLGPQLRGRVNPRFPHER